MQSETHLAAVDLGSNSFRLEIGRMDHGQFCRSEYLKEVVRQGSGLDENRNLTPESMQRGWDCLARFGERLAGFDGLKVRAVATQTLREARNRDEFLAKGHALLGFPIDTISGREEARFIYQGVAQALPDNTERRLVIDIGGRSTELILGQGLKPVVMESYRVGSISWSARYFQDRMLSRHNFQIAEIAAKAVLDEAVNSYRDDTWDLAFGTAGTVGAVCDVLTAAGWPAGSISREGLDWLLEKLISAQSADRLRLPGLRDDRRAIIAGGVSVLRALFDLLKIDQMVQASGSLRHGILFDLMDTGTDSVDMRTQSIQRLAVKFGTDHIHGQRVATVATHLLAQLQSQKPAPDVQPANLVYGRLSRKLHWAAQLHEIGSRISHSDYHKHGAYILDNADVMGFAVSELHKLSQLVLGHRGKLRKLDADFEDELFIQQLLALRVAVILCHARRDPDLAGLTLERATIHTRGFTFSCRPNWPTDFPQSAYLLQEEVLAWQKTPWSLTLIGC
jgi:exopolyphosphatase / guanosine-5'-triphosphate,3'-diphosphate pyrophosphatase